MSWTTCDMTKPMRDPAYPGVISWVNRPVEQNQSQSSHSHNSSLSSSSSSSSSFVAEISSIVYSERERYLCDGLLRRLPPGSAVWSGSRIVLIFHIISILTHTHTSFIQATCVCSVQRTNYTTQRYGRLWTWYGCAVCHFNLVTVSRNKLPTLLGHSRKLLPVCFPKVPSLSVCVVYG